MGRIKDLTGQKFGYLTVEKFSHTEKGSGAVWDCICICGNIKKISASHLGRTTNSCGCFRKQYVANKFYGGGKYLTGEEFSNIRQNAKLRNIEFCISIADIENVYLLQEKC